MALQNFAQGLILHKLNRPTIINLGLEAKTHFGNEGRK